MEIIQIKTSKFIHHFFFLQNISGSTPSTIKEYNETWIKIIKKLSPKETVSIKDFANIIKKYQSINRSIIQIAYSTPSDKDFWINLKKQISKSDSEKLKKIFKETNKPFQKIWKLIKNDIPKTKKILSKEIKDNDGKIQKIMSELSVLYGKRTKTKTNFQCVFVLIPLKAKARSGKFAKPNTCLITGSLEKLTDKKILEIILHELIHAYFEEPAFKELAKTVAPTISYQELKEVFANSLLPNGYFSEKYFNKKIEFIKNMPNAYCIGFKMVQDAKKYSQSNKSFDTNIILKATKELKKAERS